MRNNRGQGDDRDLSESRTAIGSKKTFWQPGQAANSISRSLRSLDSSTNSNREDLKYLYDTKHTDRAKLFSNSKHSQGGASSRWGTSQDSYLDQSTASYALLGSLRPTESLPQVLEDGASTSKDLNSSVASSKDIVDVQNKNTNPEERKRSRKAKMADDDPEVDYGMTVRNEPDVDYGMTVRNADPEVDYGSTVRQDNPDYNFVDKSSSSIGGGGASGARSRPTEITPPRRDNVQRHKPPPGGVRLPFATGADSSTLQTPGARDSYASPQTRFGGKAKKQAEEPRAYPSTIPPRDVKDLSKLAALEPGTINTCLRGRYKEDLIYTRCGDIMISVNPFKDLGIYTKKEMGSYNQTSMSDDPHLYMISAKAYQDLRDRNTDQVILVSGESGAGKTEATKLLVEHLVSMAGSDVDSLQDKIIQVNPLLENFGNAKTVLNNNSSRFAKFLRLSYDEEFVLQSAKIQDFMLEKSRVVHFQDGESTYHSFYALLAGLESPTSLYINKGQTFRITGDFSSTDSRTADRYKEMYRQQQRVFSMIDMEQEERDDVDVIMAAILHIGEIEFQDDENDCVIIKNEDTVQKVANLLDLQNEKLTKALIERRGKILGLSATTSEFIQFSKKRRQADDERDALAKTLYEKLFGWIVRKINDALVPVYMSRSGSIGILDICGFEDLHKNSFEQMCINIINEHLQNFMNRKVIQDEKELYEAEGVALGVIDMEGVNNDAVLDMFTKRHGILDIIDESSKVEVASDDAKMVRQLNSTFKNTSGLFVPSTSNRPEFSIKHFAGKVKYDGRTFIQKNCDSLGELVEECLKDSGSLLVKDLFHVPPSFTGSISMSQFQFQGSKRGGHAIYKPLTGDRNLSQSINQSTRASLKSRFGSKMPSFKSDIANKKTHIHYFKNSLDELHRNMAKAIPYFVRCIKPNDNLKPGRYEEQRVLTQLKYTGVTETARIRNCGLPIRMAKTDFVHRYGDLVTARDFGDEHIQQILDSVAADPEAFNIGKTQVFMTTPIQTALEEDLAELRRREEEERRRREEERLRREEEERKARLLREREEKKKEELRQKTLSEDKRRKEKEEREREEKRRREREEREREERIYRQRKEEEEEEEERKKKTETLRDELKKTKSVKWMTAIEEVPTPASSAFDDTVYNRTESGSDSSSNPQTSKAHLGKSTDTSVTVVLDDSDGEPENDDATSNDENSDWIDHFQELTEEEEREDLSDLRTLKVIKVIIYIFLFLVLLASLIIQKVSFITMVTDIGRQPKGIKSNDEYKKATETVAYIMLIFVLCKPHASGFLLCYICTGIANISISSNCTCNTSFIHRQATETVAYIMLIFVLCIPHAIGFLLSLFKQFFSISKAPSVWTWIWVLSIESLHTIGLSLLVFRVMRHMDFFKAAYLLCVTATIPAFLKLFISDREEDHSSVKVSKTVSWKVKKVFGILLDLLAFGVQGSAAAIVILLDFYDGYDVDTVRILELVGALVLVSANQWENFSDGTFCGVELQDNSWFKNKVLKIRHELQESRNYPNTVVYCIKIGLIILFAYLLADNISLDYYSAYDRLTDDDRVEKWIVAVALVISAFVAFNTSLMALKLQMQKFSFALPLFLATPATVAVQYLDCKNDFLALVSVSFGSGAGEACNDRLMVSPWYNLPIFAAWFLSLIVICRHIWKRQMDKDSNMNRLFLNPVYCGVLTAEHIMLNQRRHQCVIEPHFKMADNDIDFKSKWYKLSRLVTFKSDGNQGAQQDPINNLNQPAGDGEGQQQQQQGQDQEQHVTPKIYACATMWHETRTEMVMLLKSLHRLDYDQYLRKISQDPDRYDPNYYEYEAHIFFDDAMEKDDENFPVPNKFVKDLAGAMDEACSSVHGKPMRTHHPYKIVTPYGGQLIWEMPGENLLFVHLKDMDKIRNRKRWSQVMYMYYLLHYRLTMFVKEDSIRQLEEVNRGKGEYGLNIDEINVLLGERHAAQSDKTFVLALDGDTDFLPSSIRILMQRMDNENVGATCGRIHPIGKGPMVWYQKFEYAIGHWLQKAAEHVFGCVLCSPGCFSLFRAKALMDANVIRRYTTEPTEPTHHLQFDQGEDRWLCTLLLQRGFRIEYAAGADAWTFAPEGFFEFFNQRRRWMPSTIANILDLLATASRTRKVNPNISLPYILYTWLLMFMTLLGPGTILMMMAGAFQLIFTLEITWAYFWSIIPAAVFTLACFWLQTKWQLLLAAALSIGYGFIMVIVIVGTIITASTENIFHPSVIIMVCLLAIFFLTGICHPKEWSCLVHGILYLLCIPSGYLLLVIYSICNLNDVSWGTREVPTKAQRLEQEAKKKQKEQEKLKKHKKSWFKKMFDSSESHIYELTNLLRTVMPKGDGTGTNIKDGQAPSLPQNDSIIKYLSAIEANTRELLEKNRSEGTYSAMPIVTAADHDSEQTYVKKVASTPIPTSAQLALKDKGGYTDDKKPYSTIKGNTDPDKPRWTQDTGLGKGPVIKANKDEIRFWNGLMENYLLPIRPTAEEKKKIADGLKDLRNSSAFAFILVNLLWMSLNFMFQLTEAAKVYLTYEFGNNKYEVEESVLGMSFVFLLLILLLLQFGGMIVHRFGTLQQLLSTTKIWGKNEDVNMSGMRDQEATIRRIQMILRMPAYNDQGLHTEPPVQAEEDDRQGLSIRPSKSTAPLAENLSQSVKALGGILEKKMNKGAVIDKREASALAEVMKRLEGTTIKNRLGVGSSFRPNLPPRNHLSSTHRNQWNHLAGGLGITKKELEKLRPGKPITESTAVVDTNMPQWKHLGALGKSLNLRAMVIQEEFAKQRAQWGDEDNAARPTPQSGMSRSQSANHYPRVGNSSTRM